MTRKLYRFCPTLEALEHRDVPAGNVTAVVQNGNLILTGDGEDNVIEIRKGLDHSVRIVGMDGTAINGVVGLEDIGGVFKDVILNLKGGDDHVHLEGGGAGTAADIARDLKFNGGAGVDVLTSEAGAAVGRDLIFKGGTESTSATLDGLIVGRHAQFSAKADLQVQAANFATVHGLLSVVSPALADVSLEDTTLGRLNVVADDQAQVEILDVFVGGNATLRGGSGADQIEIPFSSDILGNLTVETGAGNDTVQLRGEVGGNVSVHLGGGANQEMDASSLTVYGNLTVRSTGNGADDWDLDRLNVLGRVLLESGEGADVLCLDECQFFGRFDFQGGAGADQVQICDGLNVTFRGPTVFDLGEDADTLQLGDGVGVAEFLAQVTLQGGAGSDTLNDVSSDFDVAPVIQSF